jgi:hypothetical protein
LTHDYHAAVEKVPNNTKGHESFLCGNPLLCNLVVGIILKVGILLLNNLVVGPEEF